MLTFPKVTSEGQWPHLSHQMLVIWADDLQGTTQL